MKFSAAYLNSQNSDLLIDRFEVPVLEKGQVLVKFISSGICGRQIQEIKGYKGEDKFLPHFLGHEGFGVIIDKHQSVKKIEIDDKIIAHWRPSNGIQSNFPQYKTISGKKVGGGLVTTFNELAVLSENRITKTPKNMDSDLGALLGCALSTSLGITYKEASIKNDDLILIIGAGSVGLSSLVASKLIKGTQVSIIDINDQKLDLCLKLGADNILNINSKSFEDHSLNNKFDKVIETTGRPNNIANGLNWTNSGGKLILVGQPKFGEEVVFKNMQNNFQGKTIFDSQGGLTDPDFDFPKYFELFKNNFSYKKIITNRFSLEEINDAISLVSHNKIIGKALIEF